MCIVFDFKPIRFERLELIESTHLFCLFSSACISFASSVYFFPSFRFVGLTIEELYLYLDDPWWKQLRRAIMISLWVLMFAIFASACIISIVDNQQRCAMSNMKSPFSTINPVSADTISRTNYTLSTNAIASNSTASTVATILLNASTLQ